MLISLLITIIILGLICWVISILPIDARLKTIAYVVVAIIALVYLLRHLGVGVG